MWSVFRDIPSKRNIHIWFFYNWLSVDIPKWCRDITNATKDISSFSVLSMLLGHDAINFKWHDHDRADETIGIDPLSVISINSATPPTDSATVLNSCEIQTHTCYIITYLYNHFRKTFPLQSLDSFNGIHVRVAFPSIQQGFPVLRSGKRIKSTDTKHMGTCIIRIYRKNKAYAA